MIFLILVHKRVLILPLFLSLHELLIKEEMKIADYNQVYEKLHNIAERTMIISKGGGAWSAKDKIDVVTKRLLF